MMLWPGAMAVCKMAVGLLVCAVCWSQNLAADENKPPYSTPPGITLVYAEYDHVENRPERLWLHLGDQQGRTLFVSSRDVNGVSHCTDDCAEQFPPVIAPQNAVAFGDWALHSRANGERQWVYRGKPLYRFARETRLNEIVDNLAQAVIDSRNDPETIRSREMVAALNEFVVSKNDEFYKPFDLDATSDLELPPGWDVARFEAPLKTPSAVSVAEVLALNHSHALVDERGLTIYAYGGDYRNLADCYTSCEGKWQPLLAGSLSQTVGDFKPLSLASGDRQWSYRGRPLFTYQGDYKPGDANGSKTLRHISQLASDSARKDRADWFIPVLSHHFMPPDVVIRKDLWRGDILSTASGLPLYSRYVFDSTLAGLIEPKPHIAYVKGKNLATRGCDRECERTWRPLLAPTDAEPQGYWEIIERDDGTRQWAYQGYAQYTNVNDKPFQQAVVNQSFEVLVGDEGRYKVSDFISTQMVRTTAMSLVWSLTYL